VSFTKTTQESKNSGEGEIPEGRLPNQRQKQKYKEKRGAGGKAREMHAERRLVWGNRRKRKIKKQFWELPRLEDGSAIPF